MYLKLLPFILLWCLASVTSAQVIGSVTYDLTAGTIISSSSASPVAVDDANELTFSDGDGSSFYYHGTGHGVHFSDGNTISMTLSSNAIITFCVCTYPSGGSATWDFTDASGNSVASIAAVASADGTNEIVSFSGTSQVITATLNGSEAYLHSITIENAKGASQLEAGHVQVWDFGAEQLSATSDISYDNMLTADIINGWYDESITVGSSSISNNLPDFTVDELSWEGNETSDRLRTSNTSLTRYDESVGSSDYAGRIYANGTTDGSTRYLSIELLEDDEVTLVEVSSGAGTLNFIYYADADAQTDQLSTSGSVAEYTFVAKKAGTYRIYDSVAKESFYRVYRKCATYATVSGTVSAPSDIPSGYTVIYTNEAGKEWIVTPSEGSYSVDLPVGYTYDISLGDANGYIISSGKTLVVSETVTEDITIISADLVSMSGSVTGLDSELANLSLLFTPEVTTVFVPEVIIDADNATYSVQLESGVNYTVTAEGVNDYELDITTITISEATVQNLTFTPKDTYVISLTTDGLSSEQQAALNITFNNLNEEGYSYEFAYNDEIKLRNGTYSVNCSGLNDYAIQQDLTSNLVVEDAATSKEISFSDITEWSFTSTESISDVTVYKGLLFSGTGSAKLRGGDLYAPAGAIISVPVTSGQKVIVSDYYTASYTINGETVVSGSTGNTTSIQSTEYIYNGSGSYVDIEVSGSTYFTKIQIVDVVDYAATIYVGTNKTYQTINAALDAVAKMDRDGKRVTIMIEPGNYEEMLVVDQDNVSLVNASDNPSIALTDQGVHINDNAVRITSYYGHGYTYYSMGSDQKWHEDVLAVNLENGYASYDNLGGVSSNGSYWNATVVVAANGFQADNIIFENSYNQYISAKEANDKLIRTDANLPETRPTTAGNIDVQSKEYVERAAALAIVSGDKTILNNCRIVGHQDSFYGHNDCRVAVYKGVIMGGTDYIFGGMIAVFYQSDLALTTSDVNTDVAYITAAKQSSGRGYLMYKCNIVSAVPGTDISSSYQKSKPGYFGRPWCSNTSEVVFYDTNIDACQNSGYIGESLIEDVAWTSSLSGESPYMIEYGTVEKALGVDNSASRASWSTVLTESAFTGYDGEDIEITPYNFTKGDDQWEPFATLIQNDPTGITVPNESDVIIYSVKNEVLISNVSSDTRVSVFDLSGRMVKSTKIYADVRLSLPHGCFIVKVEDADGIKAVKVATY